MHFSWARRRWSSSTLFRAVFPARPSPAPYRKKKSSFISTTNDEIANNRIRFDEPANEHAQPSTDAEIQRWTETETEEGRHLHRRETRRFPSNQQLITFTFVIAVAIIVCVWLHRKCDENCAAGPVASFRAARKHCRKLQSGPAGTGRPVCVYCYL